MTIVIHKSQDPDKDTWVYPSTALPIPFNAPQDQLAYRVLNPSEPIQRWKFSDKISHISGGMQNIILFDGPTEALNIFSKVNGAGIVYIEDFFSRPFPHGPVWVNFKYDGSGLKAYGVEQLMRSLIETNRATKDTGGYLGDEVYQDGCKFLTYSPFIFGISKTWVKYLSSELDIVTPESPEIPKLVTSTKAEPKRCEGYRRHGGAFTLGPVKWEQCESPATVMIEFKDSGKSKMLPACNVCWDECLRNNVEIVKVTPIL